MVRESGDQRGAESRGPAVSRREGPPPVGTAHTLVSYRSSFALTATRTQATCRPSGEICGSAIH